MPRGYKGGGGGWQGFEKKARHIRVHGRARSNSNPQLTYPYLLHDAYALVRTIHCIVLAKCGGHACITRVPETIIDATFLPAPLAPKEIMASVAGARFQPPPPGFGGLP